MHSRCGLCTGGFDVARRKGYNATFAAIDVTSTATSIILPATTPGNDVTVFANRAMGDALRAAGLRVGVRRVVSRVSTQCSPTLYYGNLCQL